MNKLKFYYWNVLFSSLIGMAVFIVILLSWVWQNSFQKLFLHFSQSPFRLLFGVLYSLLYSMAVGVIIGTVSLFFFFQIFLRLTQRPLMGFISNVLVVAALNVAGAISVGVRSYQQFTQSSWFWALLVSEVLSFFLTFHWRRRIMFYKQKLEEKKALLKNQGDS
jgi:hypothetical protein